MHILPCLSIYIATLSGGKVDYVGVTVGVMLLVLLTVLGFTAAIATGVALRRRAMKKRKHPERMEKLKREVVERFIYVGLRQLTK